MILKLIILAIVAVPALVLILVVGGALTRPVRRPAAKPRTTVSVESPPALPSPGAATRLHPGVSRGAPRGGVATPVESDRFIDIARVAGRVKASTVKQVNEIIEKHPDEAVTVLRDWMVDSDEAGRRKG